MSSIQLVVTGDLEASAMHHALATSFPASLRGQPVEWRTPRRASGGTSSRLQANAPRNPMARLANAAVAEVLDQRVRGVSRPDLVVALDDVEVWNHDQPELAVRLFVAEVGGCWTPVAPPPLRTTPSASRSAPACPSTWRA